MRLLVVSCFLFYSVISYGQLKQLAIQKQHSLQKKNVAARIEALSSMPLPFWDDFSFTINGKAYPNDSLWQFGQSVWVNDGMGISPPTLNVATFDGLDSLGKPYNITQALAKGVADKLTSRPIRMDLVDPTRYDSVFIFFYYQWQGNGEPPDQGDELSLWFKNDSSTWVKVWNDTIRNHDKTQFVPIKLFVSDPHFFHNDFQFRFQNFARLSGPFDTWNLDYVYVSNGNSQYAPVYKDFPDRSIATSLSAMTQQYFSVPIKHVLSKGDSLLIPPSLLLKNQRRDQLTGINEQPASLGVQANMGWRINKVTTQAVIPLDSLKGLQLVSDTPLNTTLGSVPSFASLKSLNGIDSVGIQLQAILTSGDNDTKRKVTVIVKGQPVLADRGDFDSQVYTGIDFRHNDTIRANYRFTNYYAYDDGLADYAASLTQAGNYLAYQFDMLYLKPDTLVAVDFYFPHVGDESNQILQLMILDNQTLDTNTKDPIVLTQQDLTVSRSEDNVFTRVQLTEAVVVTKKFFIAYKQNAAATIGVGLDKNTDSGDKIFVNLGNGYGWAPSDLQGSLMIRPVFGNSTGAKGPLTSIEEKKMSVYPNPNHGTFYFPQDVQNINVFDMAGRSVPFVQEGSYEATRLILTNAIPGIYLARYFDGAKWQTEKIMVLP